MQRQNKHTKELEKIFNGIAEYLEETYKSRKIKIRVWETKSYSTIDLSLDGDKGTVYTLALGYRANPDTTGIKI